MAMALSPWPATPVILPRFFNPRPNSPEALLEVIMADATAEAETMQFTTTVAGFETWLSGFLTVTVSCPIAAKSELGIWAVKGVALTKVVGRAEPPTCTIAPEAKFWPVTVRVKPVWPGTTAAGAVVAILGAGVGIVISTFVLAGLTTPLLAVQVIVALPGLAGVYRALPLVKLALPGPDVTLQLIVGAGVPAEIG